MKNRHRRCGIGCKCIMHFSVYHSICCLFDAFIPLQSIHRPSRHKHSLESWWNNSSSFLCAERTFCHFLVSIIHVRRLPTAGLTRTHPAKQNIGQNKHAIYSISFFAPLPLLLCVTVVDAKVHLFIIIFFFASRGLCVRRTFSDISHMNARISAEYAYIQCEEAIVHRRNNQFDSICIICAAAHRSPFDVE